MPKIDRLPHAVLDLPSRRLKALKIERLLGLSGRKQPIRLLEIGTGSGGIAHYFATHQDIHCTVSAVDVIDQRMLRKSFEFKLVTDAVLPFPANSFDVVLSNHVIEHVGDSNEQYRHLQEINRVLCHTGVAYLAVPNRWMFIEPHYKLLFLSWLPPFMRNYYVRLSGQGASYDCNPPTLSQLEKLLDKAHFNYQNICTKALKETLTIETNHSVIIRTLGKIPDWFFDKMVNINPTLIYTLTST